MENAQITMYDCYGVALCCFTGPFDIDKESMIDQGNACDEWIYTLRVQGPSKESPSNGIFSFAIDYAYLNKHIRRYLYGYKVVGDWTFEKKSLKLIPPGGRGYLIDKPYIEVWMDEVPKTTLDFLESFKSKCFIPSLLDWEMII